MLELFPRSQPLRMKYHKVAKMIDGVHFRYMEGEK